MAGVGSCKPNNSLWVVVLLDSSHCIHAGRCPIYCCLTLACLFVDHEIARTGFPTQRLLLVDLDSLTLLCQPVTSLQKVLDCAVSY